MIIDKFGIPAIRNSWCDANQLNDHVLDGYTKASKKFVAIISLFPYVTVCHSGFETNAIVVAHVITKLSAFFNYAAFEGQRLGQGPFRVHISYGYRFCIGVKASTCKQTH